MAELNNKKLPNLKICVDNTDNSDEEDVVALEDELSEDSDVAEEIDDDSDGVEFNVRIANTGRREQLPKSSDSESDGEISDEDDEGSEESDTGVPEIPVLPSVKSRLQPRVEPPPRPKRKLNPKPMPKMEINRRYENKAGEFITGIDVLSKEAVEKRIRRAKRFGLSRSPSLHGEPDIKTLYDSLNITEALEKEDHGIRLEAVHLRGTDKMSTEDIFKYFAEFPPAMIEWINDTSCNVVWGDKVTCARALLRLSRSYEEVTEEEKEEAENSSDKPSTQTEGSPSSAEKTDTGDAAGHAGRDKEEEAMETDDDDDDDDDLDLVNDDYKPKQRKESAEATHEERLASTESEDPETGEKKKSPSQQASGERQEEDSNHQMEEDGVARRNSQTRSGHSIPWPLGSWRLGKEHPRAQFLFIRYAAQSDKKLPGAEKRSQYYRKYGNPNYGGIKGLVSRSMKRRLMAQAMEDTLQDEEEEEEEEEDASPSKRARTSYRQEEQEEGEIVEEEEDHDHHDNKGKEEDEDEMDMDKELQHLIRPVTQPRRMKMYADEEEAIIKARRATGAIKVVAESKSIKSRLGRVPAVNSSSSSGGGIADARLRIGLRSSSPDPVQDYKSPMPDLRSRLGNSYCESPLTAGRSSSGSDLRARLKQTQDPREQNQVSYEELDMFT